MNNVISKNTTGKEKNSEVYRLILMIVAAINQFLVTFDLYQVSSINNDTLLKILSLILTVVAGAIGYWKNNSWTKEAKAADKVLESLKNQDITVTDVLEIMVDLSKK